MTGCGLNPDPGPHVIMYYVSGDDDEEESEEKLPSCMDYVMHFLTLFWKVIFALIPPTGKSYIPVHN